MMPRLLCGFLVFVVCIEGFGAKIFCEGIASSKNQYDDFWNLDPYCLESLCAYFITHGDNQSRQRLANFFPELTTDELTTLSNCILLSKNPDYVFSPEDVLVMKKLSLSGVIFLCNSDDNSLPEKDLARALVLAEFPGEEGIRKAEHYTRYLDILALRAYIERQRYLDKEHCALGSEAYHRATIEALNTILFYEEGIRYPSKNEMFSDEFSFLSSVADRKFGVCLGVSSLYLSLSQRLELPLESVTPPGHIYLRYRGGKINIETTAGGRHLPTEQYCECLNIDELKVRSAKDLIGLTFINQGSFALQKQQYHEADLAYEKAKEYIDDDELQELLGVVKILKGQKKAGEILLKGSSQAQSMGSVAYDYLQGNIDKATLKLLFTHPGSTYDEIISYQEALKKAIQRSPKCCESRRRLASVLMHLGKTAEGVALLEQCAKESADDIALHLKLSKVLCDRHDYEKAQKYFLIATKILEDKGLRYEDEKSFTLYHEIRKKMFLIAP
ncbi:putative PEP-CTERM system TPR-repeat lipoprotein [Chlamydia poikilotherma]|uniref:Putative PEP-CTERM system TPR-repeat lipoprotein n=1 Tax=Chlamydia poikilotherma TaxID=1967783 RepID=A0A3B0PSX6_9CHLA|nr:transglutaminase family protein [Chlamydia poikilotherma]SYX09091.1 putative PEP-CTERM system TPR-repeat lipoprotein [Chlamydia poikilotherma]